MTEKRSYVIYVVDLCHIVDLSYLVNVGFSYLVNDVSTQDTAGPLRLVLPQDARKKDFNEVVRPIRRIPGLANCIQTSWELE